MKILKTITEMIEFTDNYKGKSKIGFVPTMGYLHKGHISLCKEAVDQCDIVVASIYVNPTQFGANEDLDKYPKNFPNDYDLLNSVGVDAVFLPDNEMMYPKPYNSWVNVENVTDRLCGKSRPEHFKGVTTIVTKLMNIVNPDLMFMGEKDYQQIAVLKTMIRDLNFRTKIISCPIVRETDGLAMSSRNSYLNDEERKQALCLSHSLLLAKEMCSSGETDISTIRNRIIEVISTANGKIDYVEILDETTLEPICTLRRGTRVFLAVTIGKPRLIDNMRIY